MTRGRMNRGDALLTQFKETDNQQRQFIPVVFEEQLLPGTIEHAICDIIDHHAGLPLFDARYKNDATGAQQRRRPFS
jgi:hypothetical protein